MTAPMKWQQLSDAELDELARELPAPALDRDAAERIRTQVLVSSERAEQVSRRSPLLGVAIASTSIAAAAVLAFWGVSGRGEGERPLATSGTLEARPAAPVFRGVVTPRGSAEYALASPGPDEVVRLEHGTVNVEVAPLGQSERFRVVTTDAEVEVRGTAFIVQADRGKLRRVEVFEGVVDVRPGQYPTRTLHAGESWPAMGDDTARPGDAAGRTQDDGVKPTGQARKNSRRHLERMRDTDKPLDPDAESRHGTTRPRPPEGRPSSPEEHAFRQGWSYMRANKAKAAAEQFALACTSSSAVAEDACFWAGAAARRANQRSTARAALTSFLERFPRSPRVGEASALLGWLLYDAGDIDGARPLFQVAERDSVPRVVKSARRGLQAIERGPPANGVDSSR